MSGAVLPGRWVFSELFQDVTTFVSEWDWKNIKAQSLTSVGFYAIESLHIEHE